MEKQKDEIEKIKQDIRGLEKRIESIENLLFPREREASESREYPVEEKEIINKEVGVVGKEEKIGINILNKIGIIALAIGVGLFLKYSFPLIGLWGRVSIGIIIGIIMLYGGERLINRFNVYALGLTGGGIVILYLSFYASSAFYHLLPPAFAFLLMLMITVTGALLSLRYNSNIICIIALLGAFITPIVFKGGSITLSALIILFTYIILIDGWIFVVTKFKNWQGINTSAFILTAIILISQVVYSLKNEFIWVFLLFSTLFFVLFFYLSKRETKESRIILFLNPFLYYFIWWKILYIPHPFIAGTFAIILSAYYYYNGQKAAKDKLYKLALSYFSIGILFLTISIPVYLKTLWITIAWALEAIIVLALGKQEKLYQKFSLVLLSIALVKMVFIDCISPHLFTFFLNSLIIIPIVFLSAKLFLRYQEENETSLSIILNIIGMVLIFWFINSGTLKVFRNYGDLSNMRNLVISLLWGIYSLTLFVIGIAKKYNVVKKSAFVLSFLTITKVFLFDLSVLSRVYRVISLVALGLILLVISYFYHKKTGVANNG